MDASKGIMAEPLPGRYSPRDVLTLVKQKVMADVTKASISNLALVYGLSSMAWTDGDVQQPPDEMARNQIEKHLSDKPVNRFDFAVELATNAFADQMTFMDWAAYKPVLGANLRANTVNWLTERFEANTTDYTTELEKIKDVFNRAAVGESYLNLADMRQIKGAIEPKVKGTLDQSARAKEDWEMLQHFIMVAEAAERTRNRPQAT